MMRKVAAALLGLFLIVVSAIPGDAQFADQATAIQSVAGTNTITGTLPNVVSYSDTVNVLVKLTPANTNTAASTLNLNSIGPEAIQKPTAAGLVALTGGELVAGQPALLMQMSGGVFVLLSVTSTTVAASNLANSALQFGMPVNLQINASVGSNQLTIAVKGNNGSDPSATNPVVFSFRDTTIANGDPVVISLQAALSFTIGSGSTMGCINNKMCRLWILAANNAGTVVICAENVLSGTSVSGINEGILHNGQSGTSGGSSAQLKYCSTSSLTNVAMRIIGYVEISEATAGTWATGPTYVQLFGPGMKKPGDVIQTVEPAPITTTTSLQTTATQTAITASITPSSAANVISVRCDCEVLTANAAGLLELSRGTSPTVFGGAAAFGGTSITAFWAQSFSGIDAPNTTSSTAYYVFGLCTSNNNCVTNGPAAFNPSSVIILQEIMSELPANDNQPLRMVG